jgi:hypothetical protein
MNKYTTKSRQNQEKETIDIPEETDLNYSIGDPPTYIFPRFIRDAINTWVEAYQIKEDYLMLGVLSAASAAIGRGFFIRYKKGWTVSACLYGVMVGSSSIGKTPATKLTLHPIFKKDKEEGRAYKNSFADWKESKENEEEPGPPPLRKHLFIEDATIESVVRLLSFNPKGVILIKDEIMSWINSFNKYRKGDDEQKWLSIHSGAAIKTHRQTVEEYEVESSYVTILGGVQPGVAKSLIQGDKRHNGFIPRLLFAYPKNMDREEPVDIDPDEDAIKRYNDKILDLSNITDDSMVNLEEEDRALILTDKARKAYLEIRRKIAAEQNETTDDLVKAILGKLEDYVLRFALIIELLDFIEEKKEFSSTFDSLPQITEKSIIKSKELYTYFKHTSAKIIERIDNYDPADDLAEDKREWYDSLPMKVTTAEVKMKGIEFGFHEKTADNFLKDTRYFTKVKRGLYYQNDKRKSWEEKGGK